ncbi:MFS transporter [Cohnella ginsengisoli]|uniref:MFS transporter n=1 Tax=Cohnella ginsengisoli TaxID=425004 RepID=A0A9X4KLI0_9BACL|nr:MFS transporter [Cohnella ginsengisoli]
MRQWSRGGRAPLLPLRLLKVPTVSAGMLAGLLVNVGLSGVLFALPLYFQQARGYEAHAAGLALLPMTIPLAFNPILTGRIVGRVGARLPMAAGFALCATGVLTLAAATGETGYVGHLIGLLLVGFGTSLAIPSLMAAVMAASPPEWTGSASGALNASRQLGATLGVVLMGAFLGQAGSTEAGIRSGFVALGLVLSAGAILAWSMIGRGAAAIDVQVVGTALYRHTSNEQSSAIVPQKLAPVQIEVKSSAIATH